MFNSHLNITCCFFMLCIFSLLRLNAQPVLNFPNGIDVTVNDSLYNIEAPFLDSLEKDFKHNRFLYHIAGVNFDSKYTFTTLRIPQTLSKRELIRQVILYYNFLGDDTKRTLERLLIFPFFRKIRRPAPITCRYRKGGTFKIIFNEWNQVPVPATPTPEYREIYNQIINHSLNDSNTLDEIDYEVLRTVARKNELSLKEVRKIYEHVLLWQRSR